MNLMDEIGSYFGAIDSSKEREDKDILEHLKRKALDNSTNFPGIATEMVEVPLGSLILTPLQSSTSIVESIERWGKECHRDFGIGLKKIVSEDDKY